MTRDEDDLAFADDADAGSQPPQPPWKVLVVDDDAEVHQVTRFVLSEFSFERRGLTLLSARSASEARDVLTANPDTALILLDVVMETDDAGLNFVRFVRDELKNRLVRIVLRTGQPGHLPEERVIVEYEINDYKGKTELTARRLCTTLVFSLRAYRDLRTEQFDLATSREESTAR